MLTNVKGFTLMEILVVVTIIGILAAIAVPSYIYAVDRGRQEACATNIQTITTQVVRYKLERGQEIGPKQDIVQFLQEHNYLEGVTVKCPYAIIQEKENGGEGVVEEAQIVYKLDDDGKVKCSYCNKDVQTQP